MKDFFVTFLNLDDVSIQYTIEIAIEGTTTDDAKAYFEAQIAKAEQPLRVLILSIYACEEIDQLMKEGMAIPIEVARYLGDEEGSKGCRFDDEGTLLPEMTEFNFDPNEPEGPPYNQDDVDAWEKYMDGMGYIDHQENTGTNFGHENDGDDEDGDEWKKLLN